MVAVLWALTPAALAQTKLAVVPTPGLVYTNYRVSNIPLSIHMVRVDLTNSAYEIHSLHADGGAVGLESLSEQLAHLNPALGTPVAAVNGDFYRRDTQLAGHPRGMQIVNGEVLSAPKGGVTFWIDAQGQPHLDTVTARFQATFPDGSVLPFWLNDIRRANAAVLYSPAFGRSTLTSGGREIVLEQDEEGPWLPLRLGETYNARVREVRERGNSPLARGTLVLSLGPQMVRTAPKLEPGATIKIVTGSTPNLGGVTTAIGGGPALVRAGKAVKAPSSDSESYIFNSMEERHPRSAIGWNSRYFYFIEVDGRQYLSAGMALDELASFMVRLGCQEAMNLDGGGSATLWYNGRVRNRPCDGHERPIANSLVIVKKPIVYGPPLPASASASGPSSP